MRFSIVLCLLALIYPFAVYADEVVALTGDDFDSFIASHDQTLVEFYAPWCGHCKALAPEYDKAASILGSKYPLAKVDCTEYRDLCSTHGVKGFPTLKLFRKDGSITEYDAARKAEAIAQWVTKQGQPAFVVVSSEADFETFKKDNSNGLVVALEVGAEDAAEAVNFKKFANANRNDVSSVIFVKSGASPSVTLHRNFDEPVVKFSGSIAVDSITAWVKAESLPLVGEIGPDNYSKYVEKETPLVWVFVDYNDSVQSAAPETFAPIAKDFRDKITFAKLDGNRWGAHAKSFGVKSATPGLVIEDRKNRKNYVFPADKEFTAANVRAHVQAFLKGELEANLRSEEPPAKNDEPVTVVVGKTFEEIVYDTTKDVFVEFYAPWCGHCKALAPKYDELGKHFEKESTVVIAKLDATENDSPIDVQGFPTLYLFPANDKKNPIQYNGGRTTEDMIEFITKNAVTLKNKPAGGDAEKDEL